MKERPILFSAPMVRAILDGSKTQTRRMVKHNIVGLPACTPSDSSTGKPLNELWVDDNDMFTCPYGKQGDRLWVRETHYIVYAQGNKNNHVIEIDYKADLNHTKRMCPQQWRPSIHMPRWASRILLGVKTVGVERLQDISAEDAIAEGIRYHSLYNEWGGVEEHPDSTADIPQWRWYEDPREAFMHLWISINGEHSWNENPWVWNIEFNVLETKCNFWS